MRYYTQFTAGLGDLVAASLSADVGVSGYVFRDDSAAIFESQSPPNTVAALPYLKNVFLVLESARRGAMPSSVDRLIEQVQRGAWLDLVPHGTGFRTMTHVDGQLYGLPGDVRSRLERLVSASTRSQVHSRGSREEYWVVGRRDLPLLLFCYRLSRARAIRAPKGSLAPELTQLLVRASSPSPRDVFLDPFAGMGTILEARLAYPAARLLYSDRGLLELAGRLPHALTSNPRVQLLSDDAASLASVPSGSVSVVVTDPPWGEYEATQAPLADLARDWVGSFDRVLEPRTGRLVLLTSRRSVEHYHEALADTRLSDDGQIDILVNGHPASVLRYRRVSSGPAETSQEADRGLRACARTSRHGAGRGGCLLSSRSVSVLGPLHRQSGQPS